MSPWGRPSSGARELGTGAYCTVAGCSLARSPPVQPTATNLPSLICPSKPARPPTHPALPPAGWPTTSTAPTCATSAQRRACLPSAMSVTTWCRRAGAGARGWLPDCARNERLIVPPIAPRHGRRLPDLCLSAHPFPPMFRPPHVQEDFMKAVRKLGEAKKLEGHLAYSADFGDGGKS